MSCNRLIEIEALIYSADTYKNINENLSRYINNVISHTWYLGDLRKEIIKSRNFLKPITKYFLSGEQKRLFSLLSNIQIFYDIIIEDCVRWTIKKEIFKPFNDCLCILNANNINITNKIYNNTSIFYIHKLIDILSVYGDYDFQKLVLEVLIRTSNIQELKKLSKQLIPESEELTTEFFNIHLETFDQTARIFLNNFNKKSNKIFSICCQNVTLGSIHCEQNCDKGVWVDFNMVDGAISWYVTPKSFKIDGSTPNDSINKLNLLTVFKDDVNSLELRRLEKTIEIIIELNQPTFSFYSEYQSTVDKELTICLELDHSDQSEALISNVLANIFEQTFSSISELGKTEKNIQIKIFQNNNNKAQQKRKNPFIKDVSTSSNTSSNSCLFHMGEGSISDSCHFKNVLATTSIGKKLEQSSSNLKDISVDFYKKGSIMCLQSDLLNGRSVADYDIDNMSIPFSSEEQLLHMAKDLDSAISFFENCESGAWSAWTSTAVSSPKNTCKSQCIREKVDISKKSSASDRSSIKSPVKSIKKKGSKILKGNSSQYKKKTENGNVQNKSKLSADKTYNEENVDIDEQVVALKPARVSKNKVKVASNVKKTATRANKKINAKSEKVKKKPNKRQALQRKKCLKTKTRHITATERIFNSSYVMDDNVAYEGISVFLNDDKEYMKLLERILKKNEKVISIDKNKPKIDSSETKSFHQLLLPKTKNCKKSPTPTSSVAQQLNTVESHIPFVSSHSQQSDNEQIIPIEMHHEYNMDTVNSAKNEKEHVIANEIYDNNTEQNNEKENLADEQTSVEDETFSSINSSEDEITNSPVWSSTNSFVCLQSINLCSIDLLGFYYFILFYNYDIFENNMETRRELFVLNNSLVKMNDFNAKILVCYVGNIINYLEETSDNTIYQNLHVPIIVDDGSMMSLFFKGDLKKCNAKKSFVLVDNNGSIVFKHILCDLDYEIKTDFLLRIIRKYQTGPNS